jgi:hypothetical protein
MDKLTDNLKAAIDNKPHLPLTDRLQCYGKLLGI